MTDLNKIVKDLSSLSVIEAAELSKLLEEKNLYFIKNYSFKRWMMIS